MLGRRPRFISGLQAGRASEYDSEGHNGRGFRCSVKQGKGTAARKRGGGVRMQAGRERYMRLNLDLIHSVSVDFGWKTTSLCRRGGCTDRARCSLAFSRVLKTCQFDFLIAVGKEGMIMNVIILVLAFDHLRLLLIQSENAFMFLVSALL